MKKFLLLALAAVTAFQLNAQNIVKGSIEGVPAQGSYHPTYSSDGADYRPMNIILMIGDGTGLAQISAGYFANNEELTYANLKHMGWVTTKSADAFITDSAASGTAYSSGYKTYNGAVGVDVKKRPQPNIPERIIKNGIIAGVVSTDDLNGATPAAFFAHQPQRGMTDEIWADLPASVLKYFAAGSKEVFEARPLETQKAINKVFTVVNSLDDPKIQAADRVGVLPPAVETGYIVKGRTDFLPRATRQAIDFLHQRAKDGKGFFLMVEGARIDKACHGNDFPSAVKELLDFDKAIAEAIKFADEDGNTLVVISADHETGGMVVLNGDPKKGNEEGLYVSTWHTATPVPIFAYGPHAQDFMGVQGNEQVAQKILKLLMDK
ncbi:MAG: alkaline phosphatase [Bacteroidales bacterium]|nr:alkaline phosphatase [Bacteroidales bacterium]